MYFSFPFNPFHPYCGFSLHRVMKQACCFVPDFACCPRMHICVLLCTGHSELSQIPQNSPPIKRSPVPWASAARLFPACLFMGSSLGLASKRTWLLTPLYTLGGTACLGEQRRKWFREEQWLIHAYYHFKNSFCSKDQAQPIKKTPVYEHVFK